MLNGTKKAEPRMITLDNGEQRIMRTLGVGDTFALLRIVGTVLQSAADKKEIARSLISSQSIEEVLSNIIMASVHCESLITKYLESLINKSPLSLSETGQVLEGLADHPDMLNFLGSLQRIIESSSAAKQVEALLVKAKSSTSSNEPTDGQTST